MPGKRLFWIAIIIVELVFVYVLWKPIRAHWKPSQRAAVTHPAIRTPEVRQPEVRESEAAQPEVRQPETRKPEVSETRRSEALAGRQSIARPSKPQHAPLASQAVTGAIAKPSQPIASSPRKPSGAIAKSYPPIRKRVVINAGLRAPEPVPAKPAPVATPPSGPLDSSFWCNISHVETKCDCKTKDTDQTANLVTR